jgi:prepilin-type N-terminal cleavage/methylation domain-containing protein
MRNRHAFTLIEVLISIALISLVLLGLYQSLEIQRRSNRQLHEYLTRALDRDRAAMTLYRDLLASDGDLSLVKGEYDRLCIQRTAHSLHGISLAKVCWLVLRESKELVRVEGSRYTLPLGTESRVEIDRVMGPMRLFDIYRQKGEILVAMQAQGSDPYTFRLGGLSKAQEHNQTKPQLSGPGPDTNRSLPPKK